MSRKRIRRAAILAALLVALGAGTARWMALANGDPVLRTIPLAVPGAAGPLLVDEQSGRAFVVAPGPRPHGVLTILDSRGGGILHTVALPGYLAGPAVVATRAGRLFVLNTIAAYNMAGATVSMRDVQTGALLRTIAVPLGPFAAAVDEQSGRVFVTSTGALTTTGSAKGMVSVSMLDAHSGAVLRRVPIRLGSGTVEMAADGRSGRVFIASYFGNDVAVLNAYTGALIRTVPVGVGPVCLAVDEVAGHVFVGNLGGHNISMLDARTGAALGTIAGGFPIGLAVDPLAGRVIVADGNQGIRVLDARTGAVLHTLNVGGDPEGVAVDPSTSRAFVTSTGNSVAVLLHRLGHGQLSWLGEWNDEYTTVLDTRTGALLRTIHAGAHARDVVVDTRAGHAFVTNYQSNSVSMLDATR